MTVLKSVLKLYILKRKIKNFVRDSRQAVGDKPLSESVLTINVEKKLKKLQEKRAARANKNVSARAVLKELEMNEPAQNDEKPKRQSVVPIETEVKVEVDSPSNERKSNFKKNIEFRSSILSKG